MPAAIDGKVEYAWVCQRADASGGVLVTHAAGADTLADAEGTHSTGDLIGRLANLAARQQLRRTVELAGPQRCFAVVPAHPPVTAAASAALLRTPVEIITGLYPGGPLF